MKQIAWLFKWLLKAAIFFTLFAFALNNQGDATVYFFFGTRWTAPMVLIVLSAFAAGLVIGVLGMVPRWWRHRRDAARARDVAAAATTALNANADKQPAPRPDGL
jgi:putative membrane protein